MDKDLKKLSEEEYEQIFGGVEKGIFNRAGDPVMTNKDFNEEVRELMQYAIKAGASEKQALQWAQEVAPQLYEHEREKYIEDKRSKWFEKNGEELPEATANDFSESDKFSYKENKYAKPQYTDDEADAEWQKFLQITDEEMAKYEQQAEKNEALDGKIKQPNTRR